MIFVLGSVNMDLVFFSDKFPNIGETVLGNRFLMNQGGKGANQAVSAKKSGGEVTFIGKVGEDLFGELLIKELKSYGLNLMMKRENGISTGIALINVSKSGDNKIVIIEGANKSISDEELELFKQNSISGDILLLQGEIPKDINLKALKIALEKNIFSIFDPAPYSEWMIDMEPKPDLITPNEIEFNMMTGEKDYDKGIIKLKSLGFKKVLVKLGKAGCLFFDENYQKFFPAFEVEAQDSTAAGDVFNGALAVSLSNKETLEKAISYACAAAAISVTRVGAAQSAPKRDEILKFLKERNEEINY